ncbi:MAG: YjbH domain-containing protein [Acidiferrobacterales bacterium]
MRSRRFLNPGATHAGTRRSARYHGRWAQALVVLLGSFLTHTALSAPNTLGQTGLINMPDARVEEEGTLRFGISHFEPYTALWGSISLFSRLELSGRFTEIDGVRGFEDNDDFGDFKDKAFDAKLLLVPESRYVPAITLGTQDFTGTKLFSSDFIAFSKRFSNVDVTIGYGQDRIDGAFGGVRYRPSWNKKLAFVAEYDAFDYENDFMASESGADEREGGATYALEYRFGGFRTQLSYQSGDIGFNGYTSIPLTRREFLPKSDEPEPYSKITPRPTIEEWRAKPKHAQRLARALKRQGFKDVGLRLKERSLEATLSHPRISLISRTVGRAARTLLLAGPMGIESIKITYTLSDLPLVTYHFKDAFLLQYYFDGLTSQLDLRRSIKVTYTSPEYAERFANNAIPDLDTDRGTDPVIEGLQGGEPLSFGATSGPWSGFRFIPFNLRFFFNDPSGALKGHLFSVAAYSRPIGDLLFFRGSVRFTLAENVTDVTTPSNSLLPHVRSDVALYKQDDVRLLSLLVNRYYHLDERVYARLSGGYYEEMFGGVGGQILYLPRWGNWAFDFTADYLKQREPRDDFRFIDYDVLTALGAFHYRFRKLGVTTTFRVGRFLAKDDGVRFELKRRFRSGIEVGAWYTWTDIDDITPPGTPDDPYRDKGIFLSVPLNAVLTKDSRATSNFVLTDWTRDVGQMVESPGDLYRLVERPLMLDNPEYDPLTDFAK